MAPFYADNPCHIQEGNSGSAIVDDKARIVGLVAQGASKIDQIVYVGMNDNQAEEFRGPTVQKIYEAIPNLLQLIQADTL